MGRTADRLSNPHALTIAAQGVLMSEIARLIAHELSQPLAAIAADAGAGARWLRRDPPGVTEAEAGLQRIAREARLAGEAMHGILSFLGLRCGARQPLDLARIFEAVVRHARPTLDEMGIRIEQPPFDLPRAPMGDDVQVFQVVACLVDNAIDASLAAPGPRRIVLTAEATSQAQVEVVVRDFGRGVTSESRERLFEAFHTTKADGFGLGLAICRTIVESHGGRLWHDESAPPPGATFRFSLPAMP